ncbi:MAG: hypothetical protein LUE87_06440 [Lachnospiraceae bacterium]|nr:hypothetical protein [Lachnospiraceae bacterium]
MKILLIIMIAISVIGTAIAIIGYFSETFVNDADIGNSWDGIDWSKHRDGGSE